MKPLIIIPTLNEAKNIETVITGIIKENIRADILVVDGCSTDGTIERIKKLCERYSNISIIQQEGNTKFGDALRIGFETALKGDYDPIITMDGDRSHSPEYIKTLIKASKEYDLVIASRYIDGVRVEGWRFRKLLFSKLANMFVSYALVKPIWDFTSGYRCYRKSFLSNINLSNLHSIGYIVQIQLLSLAFKKRFRVQEIPFIYRDFYGSVSKVGRNPKRKTFFYVLKYRAPFLEILRHLTYLKKDYKRFVEEYNEIINPPKLKKIPKGYQSGVFSISIGVIAYNEEKIIGKCLDALLSQDIKTGSIDEIVVVSSGSTDSTDQIIREYEERGNRVRLIIQEGRLGKASAINEFLVRAKGDIAVIESADTVAEANTVQELIAPFEDPNVGMVGAHPIPVNEDESFVGFCVNKLWELHHHMAMDSPKCGEMVAFRNIIPKIPKYTAVDEAAIEGILTLEGYRIAYAEKAIVHNKGPETIRDFIRQRKRIAAGHKHLKAAMIYEVSTQNTNNVLKYVIKHQRWTPKEMFYMLALIVMEGYSRFLGLVDYYLKNKNPFMWDIAATTKKME